MRAGVPHVDAANMFKRLIPLAVVMTLLAAPAAYACPDRAIEHPFAQWGDGGDYFQVPGGGVMLHAGDSTITEPVCLELTEPTLRFFVRDQGGLLGTLRVDALIDGVPLPIGVVTGLLTGDEWQPSPTFLALANLLPGDTQVAFRFSAGGLGSAFAIGDVYVDPYGKG
jgi:hypothetical protein